MLLDVFAWPAVFIMENVKGLTTAQLSGKLIVEKILSDLTNPAAAISGRAASRASNPSREYDLYPLAPAGDADLAGYQPSDFLVEMENFGVPQMRHRLIIVGVRRDIGVVPGRLKRRERQSAMSVLEGLPRLRSGLTREMDSTEAWQNALREATKAPWFKSGVKNRWLNEEELRFADLNRRIREVAESAGRDKLTRGGTFVRGRIGCSHPNARDWFLDARLRGALNHETRPHMKSDLWRYLYASCFAEIAGRSPKLDDFPEELLPQHKSAEKAQGTRWFSDRFFVHPKKEPSRTVLSHYAKDGHYAIHYDPTQCRSLTVREAARLQTFPDNYFFCGSRTQQYIQVGNAVPPLLARQIAEIIAELLMKGKRR